MCKRRRRLKLDHLGQYYTTVSSKGNPGTFSVGVHLHEPLQPQILQNALNDLAKRLPHLNVRKHRGFFHYYNEMRTAPLIIEKENAGAEPCRYFKRGEPLLRVIYGARHFTLEVLHSVCDGRSLAMVASSLAIRYFELLGTEVSKQGFIDCAATATSEEAEDAYARHADMRKTKSEKGGDVYTPAYKPAPVRVITKKFDLPQVKQAAKAHGVTITEYIMAHIFREFAKQRAAERSKKPITCSVPIDCRGFIPCKSLRNFVTAKTIPMPETQDFAKLAHGLKAELAKITPDYVQSNISEMERWIRFGRFIPLFIKKWIIRSVGSGVTAGCSTAFSNLGLITLPPEIRDKVEMLTFALCAEPNMPYQFACVATNNALTLTATTTAKKPKLATRIMQAIEK
jgi:NRPS condensation-like uncharacterized protein